MATNKIGGQSLPTGLILRSKFHVARALRKQDGTIETAVQEQPALTCNKLINAPFLRGPLLLLTVVLALRFPRKEQMTGGGLQRGLKLLAGLALLLVGFHLLTTYAVQEITRWTIEHLTDDAFVLQAIEGGTMLFLLFVMVGLAPLVPGFKNLFKYHGAEHKVVRAVEQRLPLTPGVVKACSTVHERCGTNLVVLYSLISTAVMILVGPDPLYELTSFCADRTDRPWARVILLPGLAMQDFTAFEPTEKQLEVACACATALLAADATAQR